MTTLLGYQQFFFISLSIYICLFVCVCVCVCVLITWVRLFTPLWMLNTAHVQIQQWHVPLWHSSSIYEHWHCECDIYAESGKSLWYSMIIFISLLEQMVLLRLKEHLHLYITAAQVQSSAFQFHRSIYKNIWPIQQALVCFCHAIHTPAEGSIPHQTHL